MERIVLSKRQKQHILDELFEDADKFYSHNLNKEWVLTTDKSLDPIRNEEDDKAFPYVLIIDGEFIDAFGEEYAKLILDYNIYVINVVLGRLGWQPVDTAPTKESAIALAKTYQTKYKNVEVVYSPEDDDIPYMVWRNGKEIENEI